MEKGKPKKDKKAKKIINQSAIEEKDHPSEDFDFGGFPKDFDFKKNMGCGG